MVNKMVHDNVMTGKAQRKVRGFAVRGVGGRGTLSSFMNDSVYVLSTMMMSSTSTALRAGWAIALALVALWIIDRLKPATPRKTIPVRVDQNRHLCTKNQIVSNVEMQFFASLAAQFSRERSWRALLAFSPQLRWNCLVAFSATKPWHPILLSTVLP